MQTLKVDLGERSYPIHIGEGLLDQPELLAPHIAGRQVAIVTNETVAPLYLERLTRSLAQYSVVPIILPDGEAHKNWETLQLIFDGLLTARHDRRTTVIALGGGVVGDLTGFAASIYMRGIPVIQVPTTLLAQVDSSIGGKTGVDTPAGKNLLGAFHQPKAVFTDIAFLRTLPEAMLRSGLAEVIKYGVVDSPDLLEDLEEAAVRNGLREPPFLGRIVATACRIKKQLVENDERDLGVRRILNFGHTFGHAIEAASDYRLSHGESVTIGMVAAARLSRKLYGLPSAEADRIEALIKAVGLPIRLPAGINPKEIRSRLNLDKKKEGDTSHFVLIKKMGMPFMSGDVPDGILREILEEMKP